MTAPVPPDANGLREAVEVALALLDEEVEPDLDEYEYRTQRVYNSLRRALAASEAAPTAGERECRYPCGCDQFEDEHCACMDGHRPATPPADDASEGLSEAEREALSHIVFPLNYNDPDLDTVCHTVERIVAARESAAATRARAEGAAEALRDAADFCEGVIADALGSPRTDFSDGWRQASAQFLAELRDRAARSDAAPHAGAQS